MKPAKTWEDYVLIGIVGAVIVVGLAALAFAIFFWMAMSNYGSNK